MLLPLAALPHNTLHAFPTHPAPATLPRMTDSDSPDDLLLFTPVPALRVTANGWSGEVQRAFVAALARCGVVAASARSVGRSARSAYLLRRRAGPDSGFVQAWDRAAERARLEALDQAMAGGMARVREPVWYRGRQVGWRERQDNRLLYAALRGIEALAAPRWMAPPSPGALPGPAAVFEAALAAIGDDVAA